MGMQETLFAPGAGTPAVQKQRTVVLGAIRLETLLYVVVVLLALTLRVAELDTLPLSADEATPALAAFKLLYPQSFVTATTAPSPWVFGVQAISFNLLGANEFAARILTALAGVGVVLSPLLFRRVIGRSRAFLLTLVLFASPVLLMGSRGSSPVVWAVLLAAVSGAAAWQFLMSGNRGYAVLATVALVSVVLLADPAGFLLALMVLGAVLLTRWTSRNDDEAEPNEMGSRLRAWPWLNGVGAAFLVVFVVSTLFLLNQRGFNNIGVLLSTGFGGLSMVYPGGPPLYTLLISFFYEPFLWLFGLIGLLLAWRRGMPTLDRFFALWLLLAGIASLLYVGAGPSYALWLTVPLAGLTTRSLLEALREDPRNIWHFPGWSRWLVAGIVFALMAILSVALQLVGRSMTRIDPLLPTETLSRIDPIGLILVVMVVMFSIVGFFLVASVWDRATAARGGALGLLIFGLMTGLAAGWNAAVPNWSNGNEPWHMRPTSDNAWMLRDTLYEIAARESRGEPSYALALQAPGDGVLAWLVREFTDVRLVDAPEAAGDAPVVLLPSAGIDGLEPALTSGYVGQDFVIRRAWSSSNLRIYDLLAWWLQRYPTQAGVPYESVDLWVRQDVYAGISAD
jgi:hypothetical protein